MALSRLGPLLCLLGGLLLSAASAAVIEMSDEERAWLDEHPEIRLGPYSNYPPAEFVDEEGTYQGIASEYVALLEEKLGIQFTLVFTDTWQELIDAAQAREVDVLALLADTPERRDFLAFTEPYVTLPVIILTRSDREADLEPEELAGQRVAVVSGYAVQEEMGSRYPEIDLVPVGETIEGLRRLSMDEFDAFISDLGPATHYIEKAGITNLRVAGVVDYEYEMGFGVRNDWPILRDLIERALDDIPAERRQEIYERWITLEIEQPLLSRRLLVPALITLGALLLAWIGVVAWNRSLQRQVALRTAELQRHRDHLEELVAERTAQLTKANQQFSRQLDLAHGVLRRFLPTDLPKHERFAFGTLYLACEAVGGDMYDIFEIDDDHIGLYIADVSGHGISAAMIGATLKMSVEAMKRSPGVAQGGGAAVLRRPRDMLMRLNGILSENLAPHEFITCVCAIVSGKTGEVRLCNAGHNPPVIWRASVTRAQLLEIDTGLPIGPCREEDLVEQRIRLMPGDRLVFYTDGLTESHAGDPESLFGEDRLLVAVEEHAGEQVQEMIHSLKEAIDRFAKGHPSADDVAIIAVEMAGSEGEPVEPAAGGAGKDAEA